MTTLSQEIISSVRLKSFLWRLGAIMVVAGASYLQANITEFKLNEVTVLVLGLILGEITKAINNYLTQNK